jgi:hypothetical protein
MYCLHLQDKKTQEAYFSMAWRLIKVRAFPFISKASLKEPMGYGYNNYSPVDTIRSACFNIK